MAPLLQIENVSLGFRTAHGLARVLDRVSFDVAPGEIVGLVGESGCGKTTLARAIMGVLPAAAHVDGGSIRFDGRDVFAGHASRTGGDVTLVPQDPLASLNPLFRIGTQFADLMRWTTPRRERNPFRAKGADRRAAIDMLDALHLPQPERILDRYPHELSGGQRQRVMLAMALLPQPRLIVADEPTSALDMRVQAEILALLRRIAAEREVAVLFATHNLGAAWEICDRVIVIHAGEIVENAPRETFFAGPKHPYARMLLDSVPRLGRDPADVREAGHSAAGHRA